MICDYRDGVYAFDAHYEREGSVSVYVVTDGGRTAVVDPAHNGALPRTMDALKELGVPRENVDYILLTHVHLDHAGGAGLLMRELPNAKLVVHPRGARHMVNPSRLVAGTREIYGETETERMYGTVIPVPPSRILTPEDGQAFPLSGRVITCMETPGHARHHMAYFDRAANAIFTGDAFGMTHRQLDAAGIQSVLPMTSPVEFDPIAMHRTIDRIAGLEPSAAYPTHFGQLRGVERIAVDLHRRIDDHVGATVRTEGDFKKTREALAELFESEKNRLGWQFSPTEPGGTLDRLIELNAMGLCAWYKGKVRQR